MIAGFIAIKIHFVISQGIDMKKNLFTGSGKIESFPQLGTYGMFGAVRKTYVFCLPVSFIQ